MAIVLLPIFSALQQLSHVLLFFALLLFVYTHLSAASPFMDNIEGQVYVKREFLMKKAFLKFQLEMLIYATIFGALMTLSMRLLF